MKVQDELDEVDEDVEDIVPISVTCAACGQAFKLRDELAGRTVRCKCGRPLAVPGRQTKDSLQALLDEELARPYEPPPEREAPKVIPERRRRRGAGQRTRRPQVVVSEPTPTQELLWSIGGLAGWLFSLAAIPTAMYVCLRAALAGAAPDAVVAGGLLAAMLPFNRGALGLLLRAPRYLAWARWGGGLATAALIAAGMTVQILAQTAHAPAPAAGDWQLASFFQNLAVAVMYALVPAGVVAAASIGPKVRAIR